MHRERPKDLDLAAQQVLGAPDRWSVDSSLDTLPKDENKKKRCISTAQHTELKSTEIPNRCLERIGFLVRQVAPSSLARGKPARRCPLRQSVFL